jgi:hypothetical protein
VPDRRFPPPWSVDVFGIALHSRSTENTRKPSVVLELGQGSNFGKPMGNLRAQNGGPDRGVVPRGAIARPASRQRLSSMPTRQESCWIGELSYRADYAT